MSKIFRSWLLNKVRMLFCEHDFKVLYLDSRFYVEKDFRVHDWVCKCSKCGKIHRIASKMAEL